VRFSRRNKIPHGSADTISEKAIRFGHPDYNPDRAQKLTSSSMSTRNISSKSTHAFFSNLANRQTRANAFTSSFVRGKYEEFLFFFATEVQNIYRHTATFSNSILYQKVCLVKFYIVNISSHLYLQYSRRIRLKINKNE